MSRPTDFTFSELTTLLGYFGYYEVSTGKTGGSRIKFKDSNGATVRAHKPHPKKELLRYQIDDVIAALSERGLI